MNALELLKTDHQKVKDLFKKAEGANAARQKQLFRANQRKSWKPIRISRRWFFIQP
jgi:hypothetical protein